jgi:hypothetical protein
MSVRTLSISSLQDRLFASKPVLTPDLSFFHPALFLLGFRREGRHRPRLALLVERDEDQIRAGYMTLVARARVL